MPATARQSANVHHRLQCFAEVVRGSLQAASAARELRDHDLVASLDKAARRAMTSLETEALEAGDEVVERWGLEVAELHELLGI